MRVVAGLALDGTTLADVHNLLPGQASIGQIAFGPVALLRDLELRLGLARDPVSAAVRGARWSARVARIAEKRFYAQSSEVDPWGVALELLGWRDALVLAGWDGSPIDGGGERLAALAELEAMDAPSIPPSDGDRLLAIERRLRATRVRIYDRVELVDVRESWPQRWRDVFTQLAEGGSTIAPYLPALQLAPPETDLGRMQRHDFTQPVRLTGDGSLVILRADTPQEAAQATASLLRAAGAESQAVIRGRTAATLDAAAARQGLASQGVRITTRARPLAQLLPLAIELAYEPKDPFRILELLLLHRGPFDGPIGRRLARALARRPGLGPAWHAAKLEFAASVRERERARVETEGADSAAAAAGAEAEIARALALVAEWIERPGSAAAAAPRDALLRIAERLRDWTTTACARDGGDPVTLAAWAHADALVQVLTDDPRAQLDLVQARQLLDSIIGNGCTVDVASEQAGRIDHVDDAATLLSPRDQVVWWHCVEAELPRITTIWSRRELDALRGHGVVPVDPRQSLAATADSWRRPLMLARRRLILVQPRVIEGVVQEPHPITDELAARSHDAIHGLDPITLYASELLNGEPWLGLLPPLTRLSELPLPEPRPTWRIDPSLMTPPAELSPTGLEELLGCPLRFILAHQAGLHASRATAIPTDKLLFGALGHRLVEELHAAGELRLPQDELERRAQARLRTLLADEGAPLLLPGMQSELAQLQTKLIAAVRSLAQLLERARLTITSVEEQREVEWRGRRLFGRTDLLLGSDDGGEAIIDLKWGRSTYAAMLSGGRALQLAAYAFIAQELRATSAFPPVAYFSLSRGALITTDCDGFGGARALVGHSAEETWRRADATLARVESLLQTGAIPVAGVGEERPIVECAGGRLDAPDALHIDPEHACAYCDYDAICGRRWEDT